MRQKVFEFIKAHYKLILIAVLVLLACIAVQVYIAKQYVPPIKEVEQITPETVKEEQLDTGHYTSDADAKDVSHLINKAQDKAPTVQYFTYMDKDADNKAQQFAKTDKADYVIKQQKDITPMTKNGTDENKTNVYQNNYYAVQQERKHDISMGAAAIDNKEYVSATYRNRDVSYTAYYAQDGKYGAGVSCRIAKW